MKSQNYKQKSYGQSLVEFALIIPIVILMFTVFLDMGRMIYFYAALNNSVREASRFAIIHPTETANITNTVNTYFGGVPTSLTIVRTTSTPHDIITITATFLFKPVTPGLTLILGSSSGLTLRAQSSMEIVPASR